MDVVEYRYREESVTFIKNNKNLPNAEIDNSNRRKNNTKSCFSLSWMSCCIVLSSIVLICAAILVICFVLIVPSQNQITIKILPPPVVKKQSNFHLPNLHRGNAVLKWALSNVSVIHSEKKGLYDCTFTLCDNSTVDFFITKLSDTSSEYNFVWHGGKSSEPREICFFYGFNNAKWYNSYQSLNSKWPMDTTAKTARSSFNHLASYSNLNEPGEFYNILEHLFVNSDGFAVTLDSTKPWFIRRDTQQDDSVLCFSANNSSPYSVNTDPNLDLWIYESTNIRTVTEYVHQNVIPKPSAIPEVRKLAHPTILFDGQQENDDIVKFAKELSVHGLENIDLLVNNWESAQGDLQFDRNRFPNINQTLTELTKLNTRFCLKVPWLVKNTQRQSTNDEMFLRKQNGSLTDYLDLTNPTACRKFKSSLEKVHFNENPSQFHLELTSSFTNKLQIQFNEGEEPNLYFKNWISTVSNISSKVTSSSAFKIQHLPVIVTPLVHRQRDPTQILQQLIPNSLSISLGGFSFMAAQSIGQFLPDHNRDEVYIRWVQAACLMPSMFFTQMPFDTSFTNSYTIQLTKKFINLHEEHAHIIIELAKKRTVDGSPIIRPVWYAEPDNVETYTIDDQFMLGEDIVVAPVVIVGQRERSVFLPKGEWIDQNDKMYSGPGHFQVKAPLEELLYFKRKY